MLCGILIFSFAVAWRLNSGPISLNFLQPHLQEALTPLDKSLYLKIGEPVFSWQGWDNVFYITLNDVELSSTKWNVSLRSPSMLIGLSAPALLKTKIAPTRLIINDAQVNLTTNLTHLSEAKSWTHKIA